MGLFKTFTPDVSSAKFSNWIGKEVLPFSAMRLRLPVERTFISCQTLPVLADRLVGPNPLGPPSFTFWFHEESADKTSFHILLIPHHKQFKSDVAHSPLGVVVIGQRLVGAVLVDHPTPIAFERELEERTELPVVDSIIYTG